MAADWHWEQVKAAVRMRGLTLGQLSLRLGYSEAAVAVVGLKPWAKMQAGIAAFLSLQPQQIWPSRYDASGLPIRRRRSLASKAKRVFHASTPQKEDAA